MGLCLLVFLPGFFALPPVDRDESRFAQASRQMLESVALPEGEHDPALHGGGLVLPRVQGRDRLTKPPLIYWLQAGSAAVLTGGDPLRDAIWMYRVPSLLAAVAAVLATWRLGVSMFGARAGFIAGVLLAASPVVVWEAHQARADMVLLACTTVTMLALWEVFLGTPPLRGGSSSSTAALEDSRAAAPGTDRSQQRPTARWALVFWLALSAGAMTKGPITPMVALLTVLALCIGRREWRWALALRPVLGMVILAAAVLPWVWAVASRVGWEHYWAAIYDETIGRSVGAKEGHWGPPGYHTVLMVVLFWPGSMLTGLSLVTAWKRVRQSRDREGATPGTPPLRGGDSSTAALEDSRAVAPAESHSLTLGARPALVFLLAWLVPSWVVFELVTTKLPHYTLPLYPALALVSAWGLSEVFSGALVPRGWAVRLGVRAWLALTLALYTTLPMTLVMIDRDLDLRDVPALAAGLSLAAALFSLIFTPPRSPADWRDLHAVGVCAAVVTLGACMALLPHTRNLWITPPLAHVIARGGTAPVAAVGYHEDSLVFATRGRLEKITSGEVGTWRMANPMGGLLVLPTTYQHSYSSSAWLPAWGFNYSRGKAESYYISWLNPLRP